MAPERSSPNSSSVPQRHAAAPAAHNSKGTRPWPLRALQSHRRPAGGLRRRHRNTITASRDAAGTILVNGGAVPIFGGTPTVANTSLIQVFGQGGNDTITLDEVERRAAHGQPVRRRRQRHA